jgi:hypothetical protein
MQTTMIQPSTDCPPAPQGEHLRLITFLEAVGMVGAMWNPGGVLAAERLRRQREADCEDERGKLRGERQR